MGETSAVHVTEDDVSKGGLTAVVEAGGREEERWGRGGGGGEVVSLSGGAVDDHSSMRDVFQGSFVLMLSA